MEVKPVKENSKLIMIEGLPGSGKSTIAQFVAHQLKGNGIKAEWYYEVGVEHPLEFSNEACFEEEEYLQLIERFSDYKSIIEAESIHDNNRYYLNYIRIQRKYKNHLPEQLIEYIEGFDIENNKEDLYIELKIEKWKSFINNINTSDEVTVTESSLLQEPIVTLLLKNKGKEEIKSFIHKLLEIISESNPILIHLYQEDIDQSMRKMFDFRGTGFTDYIVEMICESPYGRAKALDGINGTIQFFSEYREIADEIYDEAVIQKVAIENSEGDWSTYRRNILNFLGLKQLEDKEIEEGIIQEYVGTYRNEELDWEMSIKLEEGDLYLYTNKSYKERLIPITKNSFHIQASTLDLIFLRNDQGKIDRYMVGGRPTIASYGETGSLFYKK